jgi:hypothetical protein
MANNSVNQPNTIASSDPLGAILMELRYTNYLLLKLIEGGPSDIDSVAGFQSELTQQDIVGMPYSKINYAAKQPFSTNSTRT